MILTFWISPPFPWRLSELNINVYCWSRWKLQLRRRQTTVTEESKALCNSREEGRSNFYARDPDYGASESNRNQSQACSWLAEDLTRDKRYEKDIGRAWRRGRTFEETCFTCHRYDQRFSRAHPPRCQPCQLWYYLYVMSIMVFKCNVNFGVYLCEYIQYCSI